MTWPTSRATTRTRAPATGTSGRPAARVEADARRDQVALAAARGQLERDVIEEGRRGVFELRLADAAGVLQHRADPREERQQRVPRGQEAGLPHRERAGALAGK